MDSVSLGSNSVKTLLLFGSPYWWYTGVMTSKEIAMKTIQELPDSATWSDIEERIRFLSAIDKGLDDIKAGRVVPHEDVKESLKQWLSE